jgi:hypothetical protein
MFVRVYYGETVDAVVGVVGESILWEGGPMLTHCSLAGRITAAGKRGGRRKARFDWKDNKEP